MGSRVKPKQRGNGVWTWGALTIALAVGLPIVVVLGALALPAGDTWAHLRATMLPEYVINTGVLLFLTAAIAVVVGVGTAWICATSDFPGQRFFSWALMLPLAAPAYVVAYVYTDLLEFSGPVQTGLRNLFGWGAGDYYFPAVRSLPGGALMLGLVLYPYVYLLARAAFTSQSAALFEAARVLGASRRRAFFRIALPSARPAIAGGVALVGMETVADYGVADYFGIATFTTGIFRTWYGLGDRNAALQLAAWLFLIVLGIVLAEFLARRGRFANPVARAHPAGRRQLHGWRAWRRSAVCAAPLLLGFVIPLGVLSRYALTEGDGMLGHGFSAYLGNSFFVAGVAAIIATACALWLSYAERLHPTRLTRVGIRTAAMGYALPGAVLALGVLVPLAAVDHQVARLGRSWFGADLGLIFTGSAAALIFAYVARFLTVAYNACHGGLARINPQLDAVGRSLGARPARVLRTVHLPLMRPAVLSALLLVFVDVLKELPATLILRPFNFETLATRVYRLASDERLAEASTAAVAIVLLGVLPALLLGRRR